MFELQLRVAGQWVDPLSDALLAELGALSSSVEDAHANTATEQALYGEPGTGSVPSGWDDSIIKALFQTQQQACDALELIQSQPWAVDIEDLGIHAVPEQDWIRLTQSQFLPVPITDNFWVVPSWHNVPAQAQRVIKLDPGLAFGTGTHPTTRMCLRWIAQHAPQGGWPRVLDYGCGSGILAIGAALFGAQAVTGVDIDPAAVTATLENAQTNRVQITAGSPDIVSGTFDLVLANILATPLQLLAPLLGSLLQPGGHLVLAGILSRQATELQAAYAQWLQIEVADEDDGWILMTGRLVHV